MTRDIPRDLGLSPGQACHRDIRVIKNAAWYDQNAERVGTGDLAIGQPEEVAERLEDGELLAIVPSHVVGPSWRPTVVDRWNHRTDDNPGQKFVARNFALLIVPRCIYLPGYDSGHARHQDLGDRPTLSPRSAQRFMQGAQQLSRL
jgi:hypothetical protein